MQVRFQAAGCAAANELSLYVARESVTESYFLKQKPSGHKIVLSKQKSRKVLCLIFTFFNKLAMSEHVWMWFQPFLTDLEYERSGSASSDCGTVRSIHWVHIGRQLISLSLMSFLWLIYALSTFNLSTFTISAIIGSYINFPPRLYINLKPWTYPPKSCQRGVLHFCVAF